MVLILNVIKNVNLKGVGFSTDILPMYIRVFSVVCMCPGTARRNTSKKLCNPLVEIGLNFFFLYRGRG